DGDARQDDRARTDPHVVLDGDRVSTRAQDLPREVVEMGDDRAPDTKDDVVPDRHQLRMRRLDDDVGADENPLADADAAPAVRCDCSPTVTTARSFRRSERCAAPLSSGFRRFSCAFWLTVWNVSYPRLHAGCTSTA